MLEKSYYFINYVSTTEPHLCETKDRLFVFRLRNKSLDKGMELDTLVISVEANDKHRLW